jgi:hypothetical protein
MDPGTGLTILGSAIGGVKILEKLLGPSADYIGAQIKEWTEKKISNTRKIFKNAEEKLGDRINDDGHVPPKVLKGVLEDGSWCEEDLQIEYFGGVLASSRSNIQRDDRGAYFISLISRLSTYQLRTHYLVYHSLKRLFDDQKMNIASSDDRTRMEFYMPYLTYFAALDFSEEEMPNSLFIMEHSVVGLMKEKLIEDYRYGPAESLQKTFKDASDAGIIFEPSMLGVELFMWAYGYGQKQNNDFFLKETEFHNNLKITLDQIVIKVNNSTS